MSPYTNFTEVNIAVAYVGPAANITKGNIVTDGNTLVAGAFNFSQAPNAANFANLCNTVSSIIKYMQGIGGT